MKNAKGRSGKSNKGILGFTLLEVLVGTTIFILFAFGVYEGVRFIYKVVYASHLRVVETAILSELIETMRNMPYENVGTVGGVPAGTINSQRTLVRDGATYSVSTTIRNIDDPFDGTITSTPQDTAPADYKLVELSIACQNCASNKPIIINSIIAPKGLESYTSGGSLFIRVYNAVGQPVSGANVAIRNTKISPPISIQDITDSRGYLIIVGVATSTQGYQITVTKSGYSSDYTTSTTVTRPAPTKPNATVVAGAVTQVSFIIDRLANLSIHTINQSCSALNNKDFKIWGSKLIGENPVEPKYSGSFTAIGGGNYSLNNIEWDDYYLSTTGTAYDVAGTMPMLPISLMPGGTNDITLILKSHVANSLLVNVTDRLTNLPLSDVLVRVYDPITGSGTTTYTGSGDSFYQTNWAGGAGQSLYLNVNRYYSDDGNIEINNPAGDIKLKRFGSVYAQSGWLESSSVYVGDNCNFHNIIMAPTVQPAEVGANPVLVQIASSNTTTETNWTFLGPNGTSATYYTPTNTIIFSGHDNKKVFRYRIYLSTANTSFTPHLSGLGVVRSIGCEPPGQVFFPSLEKKTYEFLVQKINYFTTTGTIDVSGNMNLWVPLTGS